MGRRKTLCKKMGCAVPRGFGVRWLDAAFPFAGARIRNTTRVNRTTAACLSPQHLVSTLHVSRVESQSGVKPPHFKGSRHARSRNQFQIAMTMLAFLTS